MWRRENQPRVKHRIILQVSFDIEDKSPEAAAEQIEKIARDYMPAAMLHLGPWSESEHREVKLLHVTRLDTPDEDTQTD